MFYSVLLVMSVTSESESASNLLQGGVLNKREQHETSFWLLYTRWAFILFIVGVFFTRILTTPPV
jgi:hypothetical protein